MTFVSVKRTCKKNRFTQTPGGLAPPGGVATIGAGGFGMTRATLSKTDEKLPCDRGNQHP